MSILDDNLDISVKDIIEAKCVTFINHYTSNHFDKFVFDWGSIKSDSIIKYPKRYYLGIMEDAGEGENICYIAAFSKYKHLDPYCCYGIIKNTTLYDILNFN